MRTACLLLDELPDDIKQVDQKKAGGRILSKLFRFNQQSSQEPSIEPLPPIVRFTFPRQNTETFSKWFGHSVFVEVPSFAQHVCFFSLFVLSQTLFNIL